jgi:hypothetical protein
MRQVKWLTAPGVFARLVPALVFKTSGGCEQRPQWVRFPYTPAATRNDGNPGKGRGFRVCGPRSGPLQTASVRDAGSHSETGHEQVTSKSEATQKQVRWVSATAA